jgi:hypothetical protein
VVRGFANSIVIKICPVGGLNVTKSAFLNTEVPGLYIFPGITK